MNLFYYRLPTLGLSWGTIPCTIPLRAETIAARLVHFRVAL
jgi:hypothetical protein